MKNLKKIIPAFALLLVSAILLGSSTYAWFSMNNQVTATGMKVTAKANSGIVIALKGDTKFKTKYDVNMTTAQEIFPASSVDCSSWYSAKSDDPDDAKAAQASTEYTAVTLDANNENADYLVHKKFVVRSAAEETAVTNVKLAVKDIDITVPTTSGSSSLNSALRVGIKCGSTFYIYAPLTGESTVSIKPGYNTTGYTANKEADPTKDLFSLTSNQIPANDTGVEIDVYIWYEGEDVNCKSSNITANLDSLGVTIAFETSEIKTTT